MVGPADLRLRVTIPLLVASPSFRRPARFRFGHLKYPSSVPYFKGICMKLYIASAFLAVMTIASSSFADTTLIFPRVASGGDWKTRISIRTHGSAAASPFSGQARIEVFDEGGVSRETVVTAVPTDYEIQAVVAGWARVTSVTASDIEGVALVQRKSNDAQLQ